MGHRARATPVAPGRADDRAARGNRLDATLTRLLDAQLPPRRVAAKADDATLPQLAPGADRGRLPGGQALADRPAVLERFETLLEVTRRYAGLREEQSRWFTLGWPSLRRCALKLGETARGAGVVDHPEDLFFLTRSKLRAGASLQDTVARRRAEWDGQRRLIAPLTVGKPPRLLERRLAAVVDTVRTSGQPSVDTIVGQPASPCRATGPGRVVREAADFDRFQEREILVARATAPAWTPLFGRAAAVVSDGGTLAAHASLVAREYGIPAVIGTADATTRRRDGQRAIVDGGSGIVTFVTARMATQTNGSLLESPGGSPMSLRPTRTIRVERRPRGEGTRPCGAPA